MNKTQLQQRAVMLIKQLSLADLKAVINYLTNLKDQEATQGLAIDSESVKNLEPKTAVKNPIVQRIIKAVEQSYDVTIEDPETLLRVIKENQQPMQFKSPLVVNEHKNQ